MKRVWNILFQTSIICFGAGIFFGVRDGMKYIVAKDSLNEAYYDGVVRGLELGKIKPEKQEESE